MVKMNEIKVSISFNHKYTRYAYVMLTSLFVQHKEWPKSVKVYILQCDLTGEDRELLLRLTEQYDQKISFVQVKVGAYASKLPTNKDWSEEMYYRLLLGELLSKDVTRVLYLDVDIIINKPLHDFFHMDMQGRTLAAADDPVIQDAFSVWQQKIFADFPASFRYFNSGVILMDLEKIRGHYTFEDYCRIAERFDYQLSNPDQDMLNYMHAGDVCYIDNSRFNVFSQIAEEKNGYEQVKETVAIIHYAGRKPWKYSGVHYSVEKLWWDYAKMTPFYSELMETVFLEGLHDRSYESMMMLVKENGELRQALQEATELCRKLMAMVNGSACEENVLSDPAQGLEEQGSSRRSD